jgi:hypothetical protein
MWRTTFSAVVEPEVRFIDGVEEIVSLTPAKALARWCSTFAESTDMIEARADVEQAISGLTLLPDGADTPTLSTSNFADRVGRVAISGPFSEDALKSYARDLRDRLIAAGVRLASSFTGMRDTEYEVGVDAATLRRLDLTVARISPQPSRRTAVICPRAILTANWNGRSAPSAKPTASRISAGSWCAAKPPVSGLSCATSPTIRQTYESGAVQGFMGGERAIRLDVNRSASQDMLGGRRCNGRRRRRGAPCLSAIAHLTIFDLRSTAVEQRIQLLVTNGLSGLAVVIAILFVFLNMRIAFWVAVGIPTAVMATLGMLFVLGPEREHDVAVRPHHDAGHHR